MGNPMIRDLSIDDLDMLLAAYARLHVDDAALPERSEVEALWARIVDDPALVYLGAFENERLLSTAHAVIVPNLTRGARPYAVVENVYTDEAARRRGYGSAVLRALLERCFDSGCYKVMLMSGVENDDAHEFYERNGFDPRAKQAFILRK